MEKHYFVVEYVCETEKQKQNLFNEIRERYPLACQSESGITIGGWDNKPLRIIEEATYENQHQGY